MLRCRTGGCQLLLQVLHASQLLFQLPLVLLGLLASLGQPLVGDGVLAVLRHQHGIGRLRLGGLRLGLLARRLGLLLLRGSGGRLAAVRLRAGIAHGQLKKLGRLLSGQGAVGCVLLDEIVCSAHTCPATCRRGRMGFS
ncbi:hypothetical protein D3C78_1442370 [compost metagenome]